MISLIIKIFLLCLWSQDLNAQARQPTTSPNTTLKKYFGYYAKSGVPVDMWETWLDVDTNGAHLYPPTLYLDNIVTTTSLGNPLNFLWTDISTGKVYKRGSSSGFSVDISALGLTNVLSVNAIAVRNTATAASCPNVSVKSWTTSAVVLNVVEDNPATVTILGINVLSGAPSVFAAVTGLKLQVTVIGY